MHYEIERHTQNVNAPGGFDWIPYSPSGGKEPSRFETAEEADERARDTGIRRTRVVRVHDDGRREVVEADLP